MNCEAINLYTDTYGNWHLFHINPPARLRENIFSNYRSAVKYAKILARGYGYRRLRRRSAPGAFGFVYRWRMELKRGKR